MSRRNAVTELYQRNETKIQNNNNNECSEMNAGDAYCVTQVGECGGAATKSAPRRSIH